jgi:hypothetical protein
VDELNLDSPELHSDWIDELRKIRKENYGTNKDFAIRLNIHYLDCFWFFKGNPVKESSFRSICNSLRYDWKKVQLPKKIITIISS